MTSSYPTSLQDLDATRGASGDKLSTPNHVTHHALEDSTLEAVQTKLGTDNSADTNSIDYKLKSTLSVDPGHKHTPTVSLAITGTPDGTRFLRDDNTWSQPPTVSDASTTFKGVSKLTVAPVSAGTPIAVGDNDPRVPTQGENDALVGSVGTPSSSNKFLTQADTAVPQLTDIQTFTSAGSGTWTKPTTGVPKKVFVQVWGAGASGSRGNGFANPGGGGGGYAEKWFDAASLGSTEAISVATGGASPASNTGGVAGGNSTFGTSSTLVTAYGGLGGALDSGTPVAGGNGGGNLGSYSPATPISGLGIAGAIPGGALLGGAGGGSTNSGAIGFAGGPAFYGGGGGGGSGSGGNGAGGASVNGGAGGAGVTSGTGNAGTQPGGGGGASSGTGASGAGGNGMVKVTTFY
jgi:hypothetical protein